MRKLLIILLFIPTGIFAQTQDINLGSAANDGTGDNLRTAGGKINSNFALIESELADTFSIDTAVHMLVDSLSLDGGIGLGNDGDTVSFQVGANVLEHRQVQDSIIFYSAYSYCEKTSGNVTIRYWYQSAPGGSKTYITAAINVTTGTPVETTSFTTVKLPPGVIIGADITAVGSILPDKLRTYLYYYEKRAY